MIQARREDAGEVGTLPRYRRR
ncbi:hypothetical protein MIPYR_50002 [uncultured Microbacterium sp.]|uniref:Uncharacterized protein n=1 Tax=uncultured Microbacterium sp. TaxID=191216 RepID=A0A1Y5PCY7_9MICO|nr:hypothetical protein MIPYR_50002 [uncultured Microbacterium sp.]